jgi:hypothetical protein
VGDKFRHWLARPPDGSPPAEQLWWTRRLVLVGALPALAMITWFWADGSAPVWEPSIVGAWWCYMLLLFPLAIRRMERRSAAAQPPPPLTATKKWGIAVWTFAWAAGMPALVGYLAGGATLAVIAGGAGVASLAVVALLIRRREKRRAPTSDETP